MDFYFSLNNNECYAVVIKDEVYKIIGLRDLKFEYWALKVLLS